MIFFVSILFRKGRMIAIQWKKFPETFAISHSQEMLRKDILTKKNFLIKKKKKKKKFNISQIIQTCIFSEYRKENKAKNNKKQTTPPTHTQSKKILIYQRKLFNYSFSTLIKMR